MPDIFYDEGCPFCDIAKGADTSAMTVAEQKEWLAFFPLKPATPGHTLVIPRTHVADVWELNKPLAATLMNAAVTVGRAIERALTPDGMNLISSAGRSAEQTVFHLHLHLVPRWKHDSFGQIWPPEGSYEGAKLGQLAKDVAAQLAPS